MAKLTLTVHIPARTVEIDPRVWALEYGMNPADTDALRDDVRNYCENVLKECPAVLNDLMSVR